MAKGEMREWLEAGEGGRDIFAYSGKEMSPSDYVILANFSRLGIPSLPFLTISTWCGCPRGLYEFAPKTTQRGTIERQNLMEQIVFFGIMFSK